MKKIVFISSLAKNSNILLFLKIMLMDFRRFISIPQFFSLLFDLPPNSRGAPAEPSHHTSVARHTG
jgi:hypothetical protein